MTVKRFSACFPGMRREWSIENFESTVSAEVYSISPFLLDKWFSMRPSKWNVSV
jgi:hypothetical protein